VVVAAVEKVEEREPEREKLLQVEAQALVGEKAKGRQKRRQAKMEER
jgi:hypothetical protein